LDNGVRRHAELGQRPAVVGELFFFVHEHEPPGVPSQHFPQSSAQLVDGGLRPPPDPDGPPPQELGHCCLSIHPVYVGQLLAKLT